MSSSRSPAWPPSRLALTRFIGREDEVDGVSRLLSASRLVTVVGAPGAGKTRLATEVARHAEPTVAGGVVPVALASVSAAADVTTALAIALAVSQDHDHDLAEAVIDELADTELVLLLDNCEHVSAEVAGLVEQILAHCPGVQVLATSRTPLEVPGERLYRLPPLDTAAAAELFIDRAALVTTLVLDGETPVLIDQICTRLDGLPLAVELAARQTRVLALPELLIRLDTVLAHTPIPDFAGRAHHTLTATIAWSCQQLSPAQLMLLENVSVLVGSFDLRAAAALAGDTDLVPDLGALADCSLLIAEPGASGDLRYRLLEPIRQYALGRLDQSGRGEQIRTEHARHFLEAAEVASRGLMGIGGHRCYLQLQQLQANVLAAAAWARAQCSDLALRLVTALGGYWEHRGYLNAARERIEELLDAGMPSPHSRSEALLLLCQLGYRQGRYAEAVRGAEEAIELIDRRSDDDALGRALRTLSQACAAAGDATRAIRCAERSISIFQARGDRPAEAWSLTVLAYGYFTSGDIERGAAADTAALALLDADEPAPAVSRRTHIGLSYAAARRGDLDAQRRHLAATIADLQLLGAIEGEAEWLWSALSLAHSEGRMQVVLRLAGAAKTLGRRGVAVPPIVADLVSTAIEGAAAFLGPRAAEELLAAGAQLSVQEAIDLALGAPDSAPLSAREHEIAMLTGRGLTNTEIADELVISRRTVETHQDHIRAKLGVSSRQAVIAWAITGKSV